MKKVFMSAAVVAMMVAAVSCQCNNNKKAEEACEGECTECTEKCEEANCEKACCDSTKTLKDAVEGAAQDVKDAATDAAVKAVDNAADAVKDAIQK